MSADLDTLKCRCGCGGPASYLCSGWEYDPTKRDGLGKRFDNEPCCISAASYLEESAHELRIPPVVSTPIRTATRAISTR